MSTSAATRRQVRVILQALKDYGMFLADNGSQLVHQRHARRALGQRRSSTQLGSIHGSDFEAVDESGLMIDPNSGRSR